jgi:tetratricopeptide (TPR) repeat protein
LPGKGVTKIQMNNINETLASLVAAVKNGHNEQAKHCIESLINVSAPLNENWLGVARMALLSGEVTLASKVLSLFNVSNHGDLNSRLQQLALLVECGQMSEAITRAEKLFKKFNKPPEISHFLGTICAQTGQIDLAIKYLKHTLETWPASGASWLTLVSMAKIHLDDPEFQQILKAKSTALMSNNPRVISPFYAALSKIYLDNKNYPLAFENAQLASSEWAKLHKYDSDLDVKSVATIISNTRIGSTQHQSKITCNIDNPIFIIGLPRSGTTLLEQMLCSHSQVADGGEFNGVERASRMLTKGAVWASAASHFDLSDIDEKLPAMRETYLRFAKQRFGDKGIIVDKSLNNNRYLWLIRKIFPAAPVIFMDRNSQDTAWSCFRTHFSQGLEWSNNLSDTAQYFNLEKELNRHWHEIYGNELCSTTYEALINTPTDAISDVLNFCGLKFEPSVLDFHQNKRAVLSASVSQVRGKLNNKSLNSAAKVEERMQVFNDHFVDN